MNKAYLKPTMKVMEVEQAQMLCSSTVINPGENNKPAGVKSSGNWDIWDDEDDNLSSSGSVWDD